MKFTVRSTARYMILVISAVALAALGKTWTTALAGHDQSPKQSVRAAWQNVEQLGEYDFRTELVIRTAPAPAIANVGRGSREDRLQMLGHVDRPAGVMEMTLQEDAGSMLNQPGGLEVRIEGEKAFGRPQGAVDWKPIENFSTSFAPGADPAGFLVGARHVTELGHETRALPMPQGEIQTLSFTRYSFNLDGAKVSEYMHQRLMEHLRENGELPAGSNTGNRRPIQTYHRPG